MMSMLVTPLAKRQSAGKSLGVSSPRKIIPSPEKLLSVEHLSIEVQSLKERVASTSLEGSPTSTKQLKSINSLVDTSARHVTFDFSLVEGNRVRSPTPEEFEILQSLYPSMYSVGVCGMFLVVRVTELPPKPWPLTVAGLPFYITTEEYDIPWPFRSAKKLGRSRVLTELDSREHVDDELFTAAIKWFDDESNVTISSIMWSSGMWLVTLPDDSDISRLPFQICRCVCLYFYDSEMPEQQEAAFRQISPSAVVRDDSTYTTLRPGIMISSGPFLGGVTVPPRSELYTTAGVLVKDKDGKKFMTVASHGFPLGEETVFHPTPNGTIIGKVKYRLHDSDIALVELQDGVEFENISFQSQFEQSGVAFTQIVASIDAVRLTAQLSMDNPYTGLIDSVHTGTQRRRIPVDSPDAPLIWVGHNWAWYGQEAETLPMEGSCGSPIWDEDGNLVSFFRYFVHSGPQAGFGCSVSALELKKAGLELA